MPQPVLLKKRIRLRAPRLDDAQNIAEYNHKEDFIKFLPTDKPHTFETTQEYLKRRITQTQEEPQKVFFWIIEKSDDDKLIGDIYLKKESSNVGLIGYGISPAFWGHGYAQEALKTAIEFAFDHTDITRVYGISDPENLASCKVMEKAGMKLFKKVPGEELIRGEYKDNAYYEIIKSH